MEEVFQAETILAQGLVDLCILDAELTDVQPIRILKQIRRLAPACPILIYTDHKQWEWEEDAYLLGVNHILPKPVRARVLNALIERAHPVEPHPDAPAFSPAALNEPTQGAKTASAPEHALQALRDFSTILTHSLCSESLLKQILLLLREILGVNRAAIFLRQPSPAPDSPAPRGEELMLRPACAIGIAPELLDLIALSPERGIGRYLYRSGRILKNGSDEARTDLVAQKEFALLGAQVAIPILDRESLVGVAVFDGRLTGEFFANEELALIFHLLEGVGLAIKNSWLHDQLASSHQMMTDVLNELESGCVVVDRQFKVIHANPTARKFFKQGVEPGSTLVFRDLPHEIVSKLFEVIESGQPQAPFTHRSPAPGGPAILVRVRPFRTRDASAPNAALLVLDDVTAQERLHQLEIEAANLRLTQTIATHLAHEIGNSLVPVLTFQELSKSPAGAAAPSVQAAATQGLQRISRLTKQMQFLANTGLAAEVARPFAEPLLSAVQEAEQQSGKTISCQIEASAEGRKILCDAEKLKHAFAEILLNAQQAAPAGAPIQVSAALTESPAGQLVCVRFKDEGAGFTKETADRATEPFFTTRNVGMGLGLTVARKVIELHNGRLEIPLPGSEKGSVVRVYLPIANQSS